ncbi:MAG: Type prenyl endopeptidase Rce1-like [Fusobacteriaceae bacterium]|jgi:membrane protease YdiL (CAAX protease family)|nr:intrarane metalloprotease [Fusobacteriales bacterium]MDN5305157.1 Type prenyl endopeptidase Rce1-like [Fusobacteriaceae bacterium]
MNKLEKKLKYFYVLLFLMEPTLYFLVCYFYGNLEIIVTLLEIIYCIYILKKYPISLKKINLKSMLFVFGGVILINLLTIYPKEISLKITKDYFIFLNNIFKSFFTSSQIHRNLKFDIFYDFYSLLGAPIVEEVIFRKYLVYNLFNSRKLSIIFSALLFAIGHDDIIAAFCFAIFMSYVYQKEKNILYCIGAHFASNLIFGTIIKITMKLI